MRQEARLLELEQMARERGYKDIGSGSGSGSGGEDGNRGNGMRSVYNNEKNYIKSTFLL